MTDLIDIIQACSGAYVLVMSGLAVTNGIANGNDGGDRNVAGLPLILLGLAVLVCAFTTLAAVN